jgi:3-dehydroquinate dehydratase-1
LSFHDYQATPPTEELEALLFQEMPKYDPYISKISTFCQNPEDAERILCLAQNAKAKDMRVICLGMGIHGELTRVFGTLWYNEMVFAPASKEYCTAPGQLSRDELEEIFSVFQKVGEVHGRRK